MQHNTSSTDVQQQLHAPPCHLKLAGDTCRVCSEQGLAGLKTWGGLRIGRIGISKVRIVDIFSNE